MNDKYIFRKIREDEICQMFQMIIERIKWFDEKGIKQWNVTNYDKVYPKSYYQEKRKAGELFVLEDREKNQIVCGAVLKKDDNRWEDKSPALYLHNFVSKIEEKNVGGIFLKFAEEYALKNEKKYFRLDSAESNKNLAKYYELHGFIPVGRCEEGLYKGILREKDLSK